MSTPSTLRKIPISIDPFDLWAPSYDTQANPLCALETRFLKSLLPVATDKDVLDVGCGTGRWLEYLASTGRARSLCGVDGSGQMLAVASAKHLPGVRLCKTSLPCLPLASASVDIALASFVLSYLPDLRACAEEIARVLRGGGELFISDMHPETATGLGWNRNFASSSGTVHLNSERHSLQDVVDAMQELGLRLIARYELPFGDPEYDIFEKQGKEAEYYRAENKPAIYILHFKSLPDVRNLPEIRLRNARCVVAADSSVDADLQIGERIAGVNSQERSGAISSEIDLSGYTLFPGLINAHDHLEFALFPRLGNPPYSNATQWALDIQEANANLIHQHRQVPKEVRLWWGAVRNLLCGVTTVCHHNPSHPIFDDADFPVNVVKQFGWEHSLTFAVDLAVSHRNAGASEPFIIHACEGTDTNSADEFARLTGAALVDHRTVLVHGTALTLSDIARLNQLGGALIACPSSNDFLFSQFPSLQQLHAVKRLAIGSDSSLTARGDLLDEVRICHQELGLPPEAIYQCVTKQAAEVLRLPDGAGQIGANSPGDVFAVRNRIASPAMHLSSISWQDVEFVMVRGTLRLASQDIFERLPVELTQNLSCVLVNGIPRWIAAPLKTLIDVASNALGEPHLFLNARRISLMEGPYV